MSDCQMCADACRAGYCARRRCYCGHETCWAFDSWIDLRTTPLDTTVPATTPKRTRGAWDNREEATWLDQL